MSGCKTKTGPCDSNYLQTLQPAFLSVDDENTSQKLLTITLRDVERVSLPKLLPNMVIDEEPSPNCADSGSTAVMNGKS